MPMCKKTPTMMTTSHHKHSRKMWHSQCGNYNISLSLRFLREIIVTIFEVSYDIQQRLTSFWHFSVKIQQFNASSATQILREINLGLLSRIFIVQKSSKNCNFRLFRFSKIDFTENLNNRKNPEISTMCHISIHDRKCKKQL